MENKRLNKIMGYKTDAWFGKLFKKLRQSDVDFMCEFCRQNAHVNKADFEFKVNRLFLDNPNKPKRWAIIVELLANSNVER